MTRISILSNHRSRIQVIISSVMKVLTKIFAVLSLCLFFSCTSESDEPEHRITIVEFTEETDADYVFGVIETKGGCISPRMGDQFIERLINGESPYIQLHNKMYCVNGILIRSDNSVLTNVTWEEWRKKDCDFMDEFCLQKENKKAFSKLYLIGMSRIGLEKGHSKIDDEIIQKLNALIDDGSIEQYRVDLGY